MERKDATERQEWLDEKREGERREVRERRDTRRKRSRERKEIHRKDKHWRMSVKDRAGGDGEMGKRKRDEGAGYFKRHTARGYLTAAQCSLNSTTQQYWDAVKCVLPRIPSESAELSAYFDMVENVIPVYEIRNNLKPTFIWPLLSLRAKSVICRLTATQMDDYYELNRCTIGAVHSDTYTV